MPGIVTIQTGSKWAGRRQSGLAAMTALVAAILVALAAPAIAYAQGENTVTKVETGKPVPVKSGHVEANGVNYYYEIHGKGEPLLLLHGGLGSIDMFEPGLPILAQSRQVIAVDLHGHGRTPLGNRAISLIDMGDDMATILAKLGMASFLTSADQSYGVRMSSLIRSSSLGKSSGFGAIAM